MEKKLYTTACKLGLIVVQVISMLGLALSLFALVLIMETAQGKPGDPFTATPYRSSATLERSLTYQAHSLDDYVSLKYVRERSDDGYVYTPVTSESENWNDYLNFKEYYDSSMTNYRYVIYTPGTQKVLETNMTEDELTNVFADQLQPQVQSTLQLDDTSYNVISTLADSMTVQDTYYYEAERYEFIMPFYLPAVITFVISILLLLITITLLTITAGHKYASEDLVLLSHDKWKTEIALAFWGFMASLIIMALGGCMSFISENVVVPGLLLIPTILIGDGLLLTAYMSLIRRIKARTIWKNSLLCMFVSWFKRIYQNRNLLWRLLIAFGVYFLLNFFFAAAGGFGYFLIILLNAGALVLLVRSVLEKQRLLTDTRIIAAGELDHKVETITLHDSNRELGEAINNIGDGLQNAVATSVKSERMKADLITNVSHDIKTPLTSIINYVDLLKREDLQNETANGYVEILDQKSQRLKQLTEDLVEASKISSGNITLNMDKMDFVQLLEQTAGEFEEKFAAKNLNLVLHHPEPPISINGDGRRMWRILENLFNNIIKYAMPGTRVYADLTYDDMQMTFSLKNISENPLNIRADELTERFIRGDVSRSTEGSGLGLSIAKNLTEVQNGTFQIYLDGDLFKVTVTFLLTH
ncbi:MAG: HAMP domain-containing sensor histidine kinase [Lachnospiraceae bacterium]|nr:HAMP domain-containing sensor histidine kinase [Lachnospiraceae bacterium]